MIRIVVRTIGFGADSNQIIAGHPAESGKPVLEVEYVATQIKTGKKTEIYVVFTDSSSELITQKVFGGRLRTKTSAIIDN